MENRQEAKDALSLLIISSVITVGLWFIPYAGILTYPFRIFVTLIHETGHALATLATLGSVRRITLDWNGNGLTETLGGFRFLISSAGYIGATLYGAGLLLFLRRARRARAAALATAGLILLITVFLGGNLTVWLSGLFFTAVLFILAQKASPRFLHFFMSFLAVQAVLNALYDLRVLMYLSVFDPSRPTDAQNMSNATGGILPAFFWAVAWAVLALVILAVTLFAYYKSLKRGSGGASDMLSVPEVSIPFPQSHT